MDSVCQIICNIQICLNEDLCVVDSFYWDKLVSLYDCIVVVMNIVLGNCK